MGKAPVVALLEPCWWCWRWYLLPRGATRLLPGCKDSVPEAGARPRRTAKLQWTSHFFHPNSWFYVGKQCRIVDNTCIDMGSSGKFRWRMVHCHFWVPKGMYTTNNPTLHVTVDFHQPVLDEPVLVSLVEFSLVQTCWDTPTPAGVGKCPLFGDFGHHLQISPGDSIPNSWVMFTWDIYITFTPCPNTA